MNDAILTLPEVAELLRVAEKTVYSLAQRGEIPAFKVGGQWRFSRATIQVWIESRTSSSQRADGALSAARSGPRRPARSRAQTTKKRSRP